MFTAQERDIVRLMFQCKQETARYISDAGNPFQDTRTVSKQPGLITVKSIIETMAFSFNATDGAANVTNLYNGVIYNESKQQPSNSTDKYHHVFTVLEIILTPVIIFGNCLTILSVVRFRRLQTITNMFVVSLATADLLVGFGLPFHAVQLGQQNTLSNRWYMCIIHFTILQMPLAASILNLLMISVDRYIAILHPLKYISIMTRRKATFIIATLWLYAIFLVCIPYGWNTFAQGKPCYIFTVYPMAYLMGLFCSQFFLFLVTMLILYSRIYVEARRQKRRIDAQMMLTSKQAKMKKETKSAKLLALVLGVFMLCWGPYFICVFYFVLGCPVTTTSHMVYNLALFLGVCNSSLNCIVYSWKYKDFRYAFQTILRMEKKMKPNEGDSHVISVIPTTQHDKVASELQLTSF